MAQRRSLVAMPPNARNAALQALTLLTDSGLFAQQALDSALLCSQNELSVEDKNLAAELFYGVLRTEIRLDFLLGKILAKPQKLPRILRSILHLGIYGLLFQDRVPRYAAVYAAVEQARLFFSMPLVRLSNAALRAVQRLGEGVFEQQFYVEDETLSQEAQWRSFCIYYAIPRLIADLWDKAYGRRTAIALMRRSFERPWRALRVNVKHASASSLLLFLAESGGCQIAQSGFAFAAGTFPQNLLDKSVAYWQNEGAISFQAAGSQIVLEKLGLIDQEMHQWWDACAGQGGKTLALLECGVPVSLCSDISPFRLARIPEQCSTLALPQPHVVLANASLPPLACWEGHILLDVPCSGLGVLARRPDLRRRAGVKRFSFFPVLQSRILRQVARFILPGRCVAYVTCTLNPAENQEQIACILKERKDFSLVREWQTPHEHPWMEGMYGALLKRRARP
jgi:16S rRNA (cytosine967-C5)-methyltransferase